MNKNERIINGIAKFLVVVFIMSLFLFISSMYYFIYYFFGHLLDINVALNVSIISVLIYISLKFLLFIGNKNNDFNSKNG